MEESKLPSYKSEEAEKTVRERDTFTYRNGEILVKSKKEATKQDITKLKEKYGTSIISNHAFNVKKLQIPAQRTVPAMVDLFEDL